jgi:hypothetical protein
MRIGFAAELVDRWFVDRWFVDSLGGCKNRRDTGKTLARECFLGRTSWMLLPPLRRSESRNARQSYTEAEPE